MKPFGTNIKHMNADYESVTGKPFRHFFCPILHVDENVRLAKGHVVPKSLGGTARVLQRKDVDQGFGSFFEAEAADAIQEGLDGNPVEVLFGGNPDEMKKLSRRFSIRLLFEGTDKPINARYRTVGDDAGFSVATGDMAAALGERDGQRTLRGAVSLELDARSSILVTCLRTSHLAWFRLCGYPYVFSNEGIFVAWVLRSFYEKFIEPRYGPNRSKKGSLISEQVKREVDGYCLQFANCIRPFPESALEMFSEATQLGTQDTGRFLALWDGDQIYGKISILKLGNQRIAVMTPDITDPRGWALIDVAANLKLVVSEGWFDADAGTYRIDRLGKRAIWPSAKAEAMSSPILSIRQAAQCVIDSRRMVCGAGGDYGD